MDRAIEKIKRRKEKRLPWVVLNFDFLQISKKTLKVGKIGIWATKPIWKGGEHHGARRRGGS
jgi:hypothetical protein